jgi:hypothetical protein
MCSLIITDLQEMWGFGLMKDGMSWAVDPLNMPVSIAVDRIASPLDRQDGPVEFGY